ncbi:MAG: tRNA (adenosine(37)-N6)-threonylcarbamoyltransferase complex transferase subunit TsaD [Acutalibacteraceae bacterium]|nr:tRNA (adenosine(37)-N6)-threonylcarbamoyltransferase complex transferase subunit TsaD [Acutalibacteraceae bacterium]
MKILAIESSCDETAAAVCENRKVLSNVVATQVEEHKIYGGVVPEIASRRHAEAISTVVRKALEDANCTLDGIDAIAVTYAPGLIGALLVGVNFAKGLSAAADKPLIPVHHLRSHIAANYIDTDLKPPYMCLVVSGGNTNLVLVKDYTDFEMIGGTLDDAAGECFDKSARSMGMSYPGGIELDKAANLGNPDNYKLPFPHAEGEFSLSFSGLKTAVINIIHNAEQKGETVNVNDLSASVRQRVCDMLIDVSQRAIKKYDIKHFALAGGVSANSELRQRMKDACQSLNVNFYTPQLKYCSDNAAMVGIQAYYEAKNKNFANRDLNAYATMQIDKII